MAVEQIKCVFVFIFTYFDYLSSKEIVRDYKDYSLYEMHGSQTEIMKIIDFVDKSDNMATYELGRNISHVLVAPEFKTQFKAALNNTKIKLLELSNDYKQVLAAEEKVKFRNGRFSWNGYHDLNDIYEYLAMEQDTFSSWTDLVTGGQSFEGRKILGLRVCKHCHSNTNKPVIVIEAGIHAREWSAPAVTTYFIYQLLHSKDKNLTLLRNNFEWHIFPVINPDGYHYSFTKDRMWRKTRSKTKNPSCFGVDLNRNYDFKFGNFGISDDPCHYQVYRGERAFSEIESRSLSRYVSRLKNVISYLSIHSYAWSIIFPYSGSFEPIRNYTRILNVANHMTRNTYIKGVFGENLHYSVITSATIRRKVSGTSHDWAFRKGISLSYIIELRGQNFTWPASKIIELGKEFTNLIIDLCDGAKKFKFF